MDIVKQRAAEVFRSSRARVQNLCGEPLEPEHFARGRLHFVKTVGEKNKAVTRLGMVPGGFINRIVNDAERKPACFQTDGARLAARELQQRTMTGAGEGELHGFVREEGDLRSHKHVELGKVGTDLAVDLG